MINEWFIKIAVCAALAGSIFAAGFGFGVNRANKDYNRMLAEAMERREKQVVTVDRIVTKYVDKIITREVPVYVPNDSDCKSVSYDYGLFFNSSAADQRLPETASHPDAPTIPFATVAATTAATHKACHDLKDQLIGLQEWAVEVSE